MYVWHDVPDEIVSVVSRSPRRLDQRLESGEVLFDPTVDPNGPPHPVGLPANTVITVTVPLAAPTFPATDFVRSLAEDPVEAAASPNTIQFTTGN